MKKYPKRILFGGVGFGLACLISFLPYLGGTQTSFSAFDRSATVTTGSVYLPVISNANPAEDTPPNPIPPGEEEGWLAYLNYYRALAALPPVNEMAVWNAGAWYHSRYMGKNDYVGHSEDPENEWYTPEGDSAARSSNLLASSSTSVTDQEAIDLWMQAPFHGVGILDPQLQLVGFGSYREEDGGLQMGAALDVIRGLGELLLTVGFPVAWPADGMTVPLTSYVGEYPDPLASCEGYSPPTGLPIILQIGPGNLTPEVTAHTFKQNGVPRDHCVFDESTYHNPDVSARDLGRAILDARDAIVLIPRQPLLPGKNYTVSMTVSGQSYTWSFSVSEIANQTGGLTGEVVLP
ncbi:MAG: hypothetical protein A2Z45_08225 [Chloroflexi bacterium RBG_19FT_COMBO_55_16]|nr:MAG: hypothetical protein A2Z45_08225 [Chloroflexi bacterium RBG_19FT_COMBO_55_16]